MSKDNWVFLVKIMATLLLLGLILWRVPLSELAASFAHLRLWPILWASALILPIQMLKISKWGFIARQAKAEVSLSTAAVSFLVGVAVGIVTPGRAGELARVLYLNVEGRYEFLGLVIADRAMDLVTIMLFSALSLSMLGNTQLGLLLILGAVFLIIGLVFSRSLTNWIVTSGLSFPAKQQVARLFGQLRILRSRVIGKGMLLSVIIFGLALLQYYWLLTAFQSVSWQAPLVSFPLLLLAGVLPITIAGIGVREGTAALILIDYGVVEAAAIGAAFLSFIMNTVFPGMLGALLIAVSEHSPENAA
jgi:uncharacterized membrane protein YbhN (UPF0104 family)